MLTIKCVKCQKKLFRYVKFGKGKLIHCWKKRIIENYSIIDGNKIMCECGTIIGIDEGKWIKLKQHAIVSTGTKIK